MSKEKIQQGSLLNRTCAEEPFSHKDLHIAILLYSGIEGIALIDEISEIFRENTGQFILKLGLFYFTAIGQGAEYHHGFYGPLPIPGSKDFVTFIFANSVSDKSQLDSRANGTSYVLTCLSCLKSRLPKCINRPAIEIAFNDLYATIQDVKEVDSSFTDRLKHEMANNST